MNGPMARVAAWALVTALLVLAYGPPILTHAENALSPLVFADDARQQIAPLLRFHDPSLLRDDLISDYFLEAFLPTGYRILFTELARALDPRTISDLLPYLLLLATAVGVGAAARALGGGVAATVAVAVVLGSDTFIARMAGSLPRAFGFPVMALVLACLVRGRLLPIALLAPLGALFYPPTAVVAGLALAGGLLLPGRDRGGVARWSTRRRWLVLVLSALATVAALTPQLVQGRTWGPRIAPAQAELFPESGPQGRFGSAFRPWAGSFFKPAETVAVRTLVGKGDRWFRAFRPWSRSAPPGGPESPAVHVTADLVLLVAALGCLLLAARLPEGRRLLLFVAVALTAHQAARFAYPLLFIPYRYVAYPVPLLVAVGVAAGPAGFLHLRRSWTDRPWLPRAVMVAWGVTVIGLLGGRVSPSAGLTSEADRHRELLRTIAALPTDALVAGWPTGPVNNVPLLCGRRALITFETHVTFHRRYTLEMRRRMAALVEAYLATSPAALLRLRDELGVTHLVLDRRHFRARPPTYFHPFDEWIAEALEQVDGRGWEVLRQEDRCGVFASGPFVLLDLSRLRRDPRPEGRSP